MFAKLKQKTIEDQRPKAQTPKQQHSATTNTTQGQVKKYTARTTMVRINWNDNHRYMYM